jgi:hypothetical protein
MHPVPLLYCWRTVLVSSIFRLVKVRDFVQSLGCYNI